MSECLQARPTIVQPGGGEPLDFGPDGVATVMLGGERTGGALAVVLTPVLPGAGPPLHVHRNDDELFLVAAGTIAYFAEDRWTDVGPGGVVYFPKGTPHCYRNEGATPALHWIVTTPSGFERFFARLAEEARRPGGPDLQRYVSINEEHGYTILGPSPGRADGAG